MTISKRPARPQPGATPTVLKADNLNLPWLVHGFSTRAGGVSQAYGRNALNLGITREDTRENVERNRAAFLQAIDAPGWPLASVRQIHSDLIHVVQCAPQEPRVGDGLITQFPGLLLSVRTADCVPLLLLDPENRAVAAIHAGWRGTAKRIAQKAVGEMRRHFRTDAAAVQAAIGPCIQKCCYEVGEEVREDFHSQFAYAADLFEEVAASDAVHEKYPLLFLNMRAPGHGEPPRKLHLDLVEANRRQLLEAGVPGANITASELCTSCRTDLFFSHRGEKGLTGRMMAVIGVRP